MSRDGLVFLGKFFLGVVTVGGALWGIWEFFETQKQVIRQDFRAMQLRMYQEMSDNAASMVSSNDQKIREKSSEKFFQMYWGSMMLVQSDEVSRATSQFAKEFVENYPAPHEKENMKIAAARLSYIMRRDIARTWGISEWKTPIHVPEYHKRSSVN